MLLMAGRRPRGAADAQTSAAKTDLKRVFIGVDSFIVVFIYCQTSFAAQSNEDTGAKP
jgi:hypothetical protein